MQRQKDVDSNLTGLDFYTQRAEFALSKIPQHTKSKTRAPLKSLMILPAVLTPLLPQ